MSQVGDLRGMRTSLFEDVAGLARCLVLAARWSVSQWHRGFRTGERAEGLSRTVMRRVGRGLQVACLLAGDWYGCTGG